MSRVCVRHTVVSPARPVSYSSSTTRVCIYIYMCVCVCVCVCVRLCVVTYNCVHPSRRGRVIVRVWLIVVSCVSCVCVFVLSRSIVRTRPDVALPVSRPHRLVCVCVRKYNTTRQSSSYDCFSSCSCLCSVLILLIGCVLMSLYLY